MLPLIRRPTRILHKPRLKAPVESRPRRRITAAIGHDATNYHLLHALPLQNPLEIRVDKRVVGILGHDFRVPGQGFDLGEEFPGRCVGGEGAGGTPFADELVAEGGFEFCGVVSMLSEDCGEGVGLEAGYQGFDVWKGGGGHGSEVVLHVDYEEGGCHFGEEALKDWLRRLLHELFEAEKLVRWKLSESSNILTWVESMTSLLRASGKQSASCVSQLKCKRICSKPIGSCPLSSPALEADEQSQSSRPAISQWTYYVVDPTHPDQHHAHPTLRTPPTSCFHSTNLISRSSNPYTQNTSRKKKLASKHAI